MRKKFAIVKSTTYPLPTPQTGQLPVTTVMVSVTACQKKGISFPLSSAETTVEEASEESVCDQRFYEYRGNATLTRNVLEHAGLTA